MTRIDHVDRLTVFDGDADRVAFGERPNLHSLVGNGRGGIGGFLRRGRPIICAGDDQCKHAPCKSHGATLLRVGESESFRVL